MRRTCTSGRHSSSSKISNKSPYHTTAHSVHLIRTCSTRYAITCAYSVTTQISVLVSNQSNIRMMFRCLVFQARIRYERPNDKALYKQRAQHSPERFQDGDLLSEIGQVFGCFARLHNKLQCHDLARIPLATLHHTTTAKSHEQRRQRPNAACSPHTLYTLPGGGNTAPHHITIARDEHTTSKERSATKVVVPNDPSPISSSTT
jgi:hypothetical protein